MRTAARLAFAAPVVAASFKVTAMNAGAAVSGGGDPGGGTCTPSFGNGVTAVEARCQNDGNCRSKLCRANELFGVICVCRGVGFACDVNENCCNNNCVNNFCA